MGDDDIFGAWGFSLSMDEDSIGRFHPKSKEDFENLAKLFSKKIGSYEKSQHYYEFLSHLFIALSAKLDSKHILHFGKKLTALASEKLKEEKEKEKDEVQIIQFIPSSSSSPRPKKLKVSQERSQKASSGIPVLSPNDSIFNKSFDELKRPEKPDGVVVIRKKDERQKLHGHECKCCEKYYDSLGLNSEERERRINAVSRHRSTYRPFKRAKTPEHFWDVDFPSTQELYNRGYIKRLWNNDESTSKE